MTTESYSVIEFGEAPPRVSEWRRFRRVFLSRGVVVFGLVVLLVLFFTAIFAHWLAPYDPYKPGVAKSLAQPSWEHPLGSDILGRDTLSRLIFGIRPTLIVGFCTVVISVGVGTLLGLTAGYFGGWTMTIIMRLIDALMGIPRILLALVIAVALGGGMKNIIIALSIAMLAGPARVMCGQTLSIKENDYVMAGRSLGFSNLRLMLRHIIPNAFVPLIIIAVMEIGIVILSEAGLSFLGIGIRAPQASWGSMVSLGYKYLVSNPMLSFAPGIAIMLLVFSLNMVGDGLRDALDPRLRGTV